MSCLVDGFGVPPEGMDDEALVGGDEEGGGWDVGDDDLELPADLVRHALSLSLVTPGSHKKSNLRVCFIWCSIQSVGQRKALYIFCPPPCQTCSFRHQLGFSGKHSSHAAIMRGNYSLTFPPLSTAS